MRRYQAHRDQPTLFGGPVRHDDASTSPARIDNAGNVHRARAGDPATSHEGAEYAAAMLTHTQYRVLQAFNTPRTCEEAGEYARQCYGGKSQQTYRKRANELARMGLIVEVDRRPCTFTKSPTSAAVFIRWELARAEQ